MYQVSLKIFLVLKVAVDFRELLRKKLERVCMKGVFGMTSFIENILTIM